MKYAMQTPMIPAPTIMMVSLPLCFPDGVELNFK